LSLSQARWDINLYLYLTWLLNLSACLPIVCSGRPGCVSPTILGRWDRSWFISMTRVTCPGGLNTAAAVYAHFTVLFASLGFLYCQTVICFDLTTCAYIMPEPTADFLLAFLWQLAPMVCSTIVGFLNETQDFVPSNRPIFNLPLNEFTSCMRRLPIWIARKPTCKHGLTLIPNSSLNFLKVFWTLYSKPCKFGFVEKSFHGLDGWSQLNFSARKINIFDDPGCLLCLLVFQDQRSKIITFSEYLSYSNGSGSNFFDPGGVSHLWFVFGFEIISKKSQIFHFFALRV